MNLYTVKSYAMAIRLGSKFAYQTVPRLLSIWLDMGEDEVFANSDSFVKINEEIQRAIVRTPVYKVGSHGFHFNSSLILVCSG